jgi:hypothetical protein
LRSSLITGLLRSYLNTAGSPENSLLPGRWPVAYRRRGVWTVDLVICPNDRRQNRQRPKGRRQRIAATEGRQTTARIGADRLVLAAADGDPVGC